MQYPQGSVAAERDHGGARLWGGVWLWDPSTVVRRHIVARSPESSKTIAVDPLSRLATDLGARSYARRSAAVRGDTIHVVLVDDHTLIREGVRVLLQTAPDIRVIGEAESAATALAVIRRVVPHVVVLDLDMPGGDGASVLVALREELPAVRVLILTVHPEQSRLVPLLQAGARGYITKDAASRELVEAVRVVAGGDIYVRPSVARVLATAMVSKPAASTPRDRFDALSDRERTVLQMVAQGYSGAEIARCLGVSTKTVDAYKHRVHDKLGLQHRTDYVRFAIEAQILGA
jgi:DNA-binding NarL/FixJ family response regulator